MSPTVDVLQRILWELEKADELLAEAYSIGLWVKADDSSDNRRRRTVLREADWEVSAAMRNAAELQIDRQLEQDLHALMKLLEPLPDLVSDTMIDNPPELDGKISEAREEIGRLRGRVEGLLRG
jgi:hypothetical protein